VEIDFNEVGRLYKVWVNMMQRCSNPKNKQYKDYGGRGIFVVSAWQDFHTFCTWALANGSEKGKHLDRENNDGHYGPDNCRFVTPFVNANNKRNNHLIVAFGESKTLADWARDSRCVVIDSTIRRRLQAGWTPEEALTLKSAKDRVRPCPSGHLLTPENTYRRKNGDRLCAVCSKEQAKEKYWASK
jgi:hypothetical protein